MYKFLLILAMTFVTACTSAEKAADVTVTSDSIVVVADTTKVDSVVVADTTSK